MRSHPGRGRSRTRECPGPDSNCPSGLSGRPLRRHPAVSQWSTTISPKPLPFPSTNFTKWSERCCFSFCDSFRHWAGQSRGYLGQGVYLSESENEVAQSCPTPRDPMDCSLPGFSIHEIFQARVPEWVAVFQGIFLTQGSNHGLSCIAGRRFTLWASLNVKADVQLGDCTSWVSQVPV